jgi:very-short-patch-repair endonuclease
MRKRIEQLPPVSSELRTRAIELRSKMNDVERKMWHSLRGRQLGAFFHRQRVVGRYICDFVSLDAGLVIEVDGSQHVTVEGKIYDRKRDIYLRSLGFKVLRFSDYEVLKNMEGVLSTIWDKLK